MGILHFDSTKTPHDVIGYRRTARTTPTGSRNRGGGRTPWRTWLTTEESNGGSVYEVDPNLLRVQTIVVFQLFLKRGADTSRTHSGNFLLITSIISTQQRILN